MNLSEMLIRTKFSIKIHDYEQAIKLLLKILLEDSSSANLYILLGNCYQAIKKYDDAINNYQLAIQKDPSLIEPYNNLGVISKIKGEYDNALKYFKEALEVDPERADIYYNIGNVYRSLNRNNEAINSYKIAIQKNPDYDLPYNNIGIVYQEMERYDEAIASYQHGLTIDPNNIKLHYNLGVIYEKMGHLEEALSHYTKAIEKNPNYLEAHNNLGVIYEKLENYEEAKNCYEDALSIDNNYIKAKNNLALLHEKMGNNAEAVKLYSEALSINPNYTIALKNIGRVYKNSGKYLEAENIYEKLLKLNGSDIDIRYQLAGVEEKLNPSKSIEMYRQCILDAPDRLEIRRSLADLYANLDRADEAMKELSDLDKIAPLNTQSKINMARLANDTGDTTETIRILKELLLCEPDNKEALFFLGSIYLDSDVKKAVEIFEKLNQLDETNVWVKYHLAQAYRANGSPENALKLIEPFLDIHRDSQECIDSNINTFNKYFKMYEESITTMYKDNETAQRYRQKLYDIDFSLYEEEKFLEEGFIDSDPIDTYDDISILNWGDSFSEYQSDTETDSEEELFPSIEEEEEWDTIKKSSMLGLIEKEELSSEEESLSEKETEEEPILSNEAKNESEDSAPLQNTSSSASPVSNFSPFSAPPFSSPYAQQQPMPPFFPPPGNPYPPPPFYPPQEASSQPAPTISNAQSSPFETGNAIPPYPPPSSAFPSMSRPIGSSGENPATPSFPLTEDPFYNNQSKAPEKGGQGNGREEDFAELPEEVSEYNNEIQQEILEDLGEADLNPSTEINSFMELLPETEEKGFESEVDQWLDDFFPGDELLPEEDPSTRPLEPLEADLLAPEKEIEKLPSDELSFPDFNGGNETLSENEFADELPIGPSEEQIEELFLQEDTEEGGPLPAPFSAETFLPEEDPSTRPLEPLEADLLAPEKEIEKLPSDELSFPDFNGGNETLSENEFTDELPIGPSEEQIEELFLQEDTEEGGPLPAPFSAETFLPEEDPSTQPLEPLEADLLTPEKEIEKLPSDELSFPDFNDGNETLSENEFANELPIGPSEEQIEEFLLQGDTEEGEPLPAPFSAETFLPEEDPSAQLLESLEADLHASEKEIEKLPSDELSFPDFNDRNETLSENEFADELPIGPSEEQIEEFLLQGDTEEEEVEPLPPLFSAETFLPEKIPFDPGKDLPELFRDFGEDILKNEKEGRPLESTFDPGINLNSSIHNYFPSVIKESVIKTESKNIKVTTKLIGNIEVDFFD